MTIPRENLPSVIKVIYIYILSILSKPSGGGKGGIISRIKYNTLCAVRFQQF